MDVNRQPGIRKYLQVSLRFLFAILTATCIVVFIDPLGWKPPPRIPIRSAETGKTAQVDLIEINHFYGTNVGRNVRQVILWSYYADGHLHVRDWRIVESNKIGNFSVKPIGRGWHECSWMQDGAAWCVQAPSYRETHTQTDPEVEDRTSLEKIRRAPLWTSPATATASKEGENADRR
jgi:hypothetical protein